jgi:hypothetical protein
MKVNIRPKKNEQANQVASVLSKIWNSKFKNIKGVWNNQVMELSHK